MERRIGEQFDYNGVTLEVVDRTNYICEDCFFFKKPIEFCFKMKCSMYEREDNTEVLFKEVKK